MVSPHLSGSLSYTWTTSPRCARRYFVNFWAGGQRSGVVIRVRKRDEPRRADHFATRCGYTQRSVRNYDQKSESHDRASACEVSQLREAKLDGFLASHVEFCVRGETTMFDNGKDCEPRAARWKNSVPPLSTR